jgi:hypothetical protein
MWISAEKIHMFLGQLLTDLNSTFSPEAAAGTDPK